MARKSMEFHGISMLFHACQLICQNKEEHGKSMDIPWNSQIRKKEREKSKEKHGNSKVLPI